MESKVGKRYKLSGMGIFILLVISLSGLVLNQLENSIGQKQQQEAEEKQKNTVSMLTSTIL
jgi:hypothetical protein